MKGKRVKKREHKFLIIVLIWIISFYSAISICCNKTASTKDEVAKATCTEKAKIAKGNIQGDNIPATNYASLEMMKKDGKYVEQAFTYKHVLKVKVTYYCGCTKCCGKWSNGKEQESYGALGTKLVPYYSIAVAPEVIPLGTIVIDSKGNKYKAEDTGSAIKGNRIDIYTGNHKEAKKLGTKEIELFW